LAENLPRANLTPGGRTGYYLARGCKALKEETFQQSLPDDPPGNRPNAGPNPFLAID
jgi:hypothetical protein